eukprot:CAMPEP_0172897064 /NCGR_PEP_ID=MMETSP1075-20121228/156737_1 /TAXON_ID=2916 /ORGANISM="Ceratium fusus, Strain PA161109" /LENGTH=361 /DNA_ID=CAMNT_0013752561 /DNA_START=13 /DNA_END=1095 /DNA_ORIENTATION=+
MSLIGFAGMVESGQNIMHFCGRTGLLTALLGLLSIVCWFRGSKRKSRLHAVLGELRVARERVLDEQKRAHDAIEAYEKVSQELVAERLRAKEDADSRTELALDEFEQIRQRFLKLRDDKRQVEEALVQERASNVSPDCQQMQGAPAGFAVAPQSPVLSGVSDQFKPTCLRVSAGKGGSERPVCCPVRFAAEAALARLGLDNARFVDARGHCHCGDCQPADMGSNGLHPFAVPCGWVRFSLRLPPGTKISDVLPQWSLSFHGLEHDIVKSVMEHGACLAIPRGHDKQKGKDLSFNAECCEPGPPSSAGVKYACIQLHAEPSLLDDDLELQMVLQCWQLPDTDGIQDGAMACSEQAADMAAKW